MSLVSSEYLDKIGENKTNYMLNKVKHSFREMEISIFHAVFEPIVSILHEVFQYFGCFMKTKAMKNQKLLNKGQHKID